MIARRIVSFLPAATEMVCALGGADRLVGITHECDYPPEITESKPIVVHSALKLEGLSLREIDEAVSQRLHTGASLYEVDEKLLQKLKPDLIITQNLCQVCAPSGNEVSQLLTSLRPKPEVLWFTPKSLEEINQNIRDLGEVMGVQAKAEALIARGDDRLRKISKITKNLQYRPRVFCMEWVDPVYCSGHWVPTMVELAGGVDSLGRKETYSVRIPWEDVINYAPEVLIISPCGFNLEKVLQQIPQLYTYPGWRELPAVQQGKVYAVDANAYFARPGPRVIEGVELLAYLIHPEHFKWNGPKNAFKKVRVPGEQFRRTKICETCREPFPCYSEECWCNDLPPLSSVDPRHECFCPKCFALAVTVSEKS